MTIKEFYEFLLTAEDLYEDEFDRTGEYSAVIGVRWEELDRKVGEEVGRSKHNIEREDEREMPEHGTDEYENMFELDGASSYSVQHLLDDLEYKYRNNPDDPLKRHYNATGAHCYLIGGKYTANHTDGLDGGELVIVDSKVIVKLY